MMGIIVFGDMMNKSCFIVLLNNEFFMVILYCELIGWCFGVVNYYDKFIGNIILKKGVFMFEFIQWIEVFVLDFQCNDGCYVVIFVGFYSVFDVGVDILFVFEGYYIIFDYMFDVEMFDIDSVFIDYFLYMFGVFIIWDICL